jgi:hypothetical protein
MHLNTIAIMRVGAIDGNYKRSVIDRLQGDLVPSWGYDKKKYKAFDDMLRKKQIQYIYFMASAKKGICALVKIGMVKDRELGPLIALDETDEEKGWMKDKASDDWNTEFTIDEFWDLSCFNATVFSHETIQTNNEDKTIPPCSVHRLSNDCRPSLYQYLHKHTDYIVNNIIPTWKSR